MLAGATVQGMQVQTVPISELHADPANVRRHAERNLDAVKASLAKFGQQKPIVVDAKGLVVAGNATLAAAQDLGWEELAVARTALTGAQAAAYAIADNRTGELAEWDPEGLGSILEALRADPEIDHLVTGFTDEEIDELLKAPQIPDEGTEFDESCADDVKLVICPKCGEKFPP